MRYSPPSFALALLASLIAAATALAAESTPLRFDRDIRPLLSRIKDSPANGTSSTITELMSGS